MCGLEDSIVHDWSAFFIHYKNKLGMQTQNFFHWLNYSSKKKTNLLEVDKQYHITFAAFTNKSVRTWSSLQL